MTDLLMGIVLIVGLSAASLAFLLLVIEAIAWKRKGGNLFRRPQERSHD